MIASPSTAFIKTVASIYPGRASSSPIIDLFMTMLSMGRSGYVELLNQQKIVFKHLLNGLQVFVDKFQGRLLHSPSNDISLSVTIPMLHDGQTDMGPTFFGSMLFQRQVSGCRVVVITNTPTLISGYQFVNWNSHSSHHHDVSSYLTAAAGIGMTASDVDVFIGRLHKAADGYMKKMNSTVSSFVHGELAAAATESASQVQVDLGYEDEDESSAI